MSDAVIWVTGAAVIWSVGLLGAVVFIAAANALAVWAATHYAKRFGNVNKNLCDMSAWVANGKPQWRRVDGRFQLVPIEQEEAA